MTGRPNAMVTGSASGIGFAVAERLHARGWYVVGIDRKPEGADGIDRFVGEAGDPELLRRAVERCGGRLAGLVCSAGVPPRGPWDDRTHWDEVLAVNLTAPYEALRICLPALRAARGSAVLVGSIVGSAEGSTRSPAYAAAKAGLEGLARSLTLVAARDSVRINVVAPGAVDTPFDELLLSPGERRDIPLGRMGTAAEIAAVVTFLLEPDASYVNGAVWRVDGGRSVLPAVDVLAAAEAARGPDRPTPG